MIKALIAVVVLIVIAGIALVVLKKLQDRQGGVPRLPANKRLTINPDDEIIEELSQPQTHHIPQSANPYTSIPPSAGDELAAVDEYLRLHNYTEAINSLKRILMTNPRHTGAMLKLLQTYGISKQYIPFNQLHQKIHEIADPVTIKEADFCKSLIDSEIADAAKAAAAHQAANRPIDEGFATLDFNLDGPYTTDEPSTQTVHEPVAQPEPESDEDIFELNFENLDNIAATTNITSTPQAQSAEPADPFDFSDDLLADFEASVQNNQHAVSLSAEPTPVTTPTERVMPVVEAPVTSAQMTPADSFDFTFDDVAITSTTEPVAAPQDTIINEPVPDVASDDFGFDFNFNEAANVTSLESLDELDTTQTGEISSFDMDIPTAPTQSESTSVASVQPDTTFDFTATPQTEEISTPTSVAQTTSTVSNDFDGLEFDLSSDLVAETTPVASTASNLTTQTMDNFEGLSLDLDVSTPSMSESAPIPTIEVAPSSQMQEEISGSTDGIDFEWTTSTTEAATTTTSVDDDLSFDINFGDATTKTSDSDMADTLDTITSIDDDFSTNGTSSIHLDTISNDIDNTLITSTPKTTAPILEITPKTSVETTVDNDFSFVESPESVQVTLDLAKQYVALGEYDSAKRLLDEVASSSNATQRQQAQQLIAQLG